METFFELTKVLLMLAGIVYLTTIGLDGLMGFISWVSGDTKRYEEHLESLKLWVVGQRSKKIEQ